MEQRPGITVAELAEEMGVSMQRAWQYVGRLDFSASVLVRGTSASALALRATCAKGGRVRLEADR